MRLWKGCFEMNEKQAAIDALILFRQLWCVDREATEKCDEPIFRCSDCPMSPDGARCDARMLILKHGTEDQKNRMNAMW